MGILSRRARSRTSRWFIVLGLLASMALVASVASAVSGDLTAPGSSITINDAIFEQQVPPGSSGSGVWTSFVRVSANTDVVQGYNSDFRPQQFDEDTAKGFNRSVLLSSVPVVEQGGTAYREFRLDINQNTGIPDQYISLDKVEIYTTANPALTGYDPATKFGPDANLRYDMDAGEDSTVKLDYTLGSGSGTGDMVLLVPDSLFPVADCEYGAGSCSTFVVLYSLFGEGFPNNDGFEEWALLLRPVVDVQKTAIGTYVREIDWSMDKTVAPSSASGFPGDSLPFGYTVDYTKTVIESNFSVSGTVSITNPTGKGVAPLGIAVDAEITEISDVIAGYAGSVVVDCGLDATDFPYTLKAGASLECTYSASEAAGPNPFGDTNTAYATVLSGYSGATATFDGSAPIAFTATTIGDESVVVDDDNAGIESSGVAPNGESIGDSTGYAYIVPQVCSSTATDYVNGRDQITWPNTATADGSVTDLEETETVTVDCYSPVVSKTAQGDYELGHTWTIDKKYDKNYVMFAGESVIHDYEITLNETEGEQNFEVTGKISVTNPAGSPGEMVVALADILDDGTEATIADCTEGTWDGTGETVTVAAGDTAVCDYEALPSDKAAAENKVTATFSGIDFIAEKEFSWKKTDVGFTEVNVTDDYGTAGDPSDDLSFGPFTGDAKPAYPRTFECSADPAMYKDGGSYSYSVTNWAMIDETKDKDDATVNVLCVAPVVTKTAKGNYDEDHQWKIEKGPDGEYWKFAGETATHGYAIKLTETVKDQNFAVTGTISVENLHPTMPMTVTLSDKLDDGTVAKLLCTDDDLVTPGHQVTIADESAVLCGYEATPGTKTAKNNTAKAVFSGVDYTKTVGFSWTPALTGEPDEVDVTDKADDGTDARTYGPFLTSKSFDTEGSWMCSDDPADYTNGYYSFTVKNTATIDQTGDNDSATVKVNCYAPVVAKTATPEFTRTYHWDIDKEAFLADGSVVPAEGLNLEYGQSYNLEWEVVVTNTGFTDSDWGITGVITVDNPNPMAAMTVTLTDELDDLTVGSIAGCTGGTLTGDSLEIPAGGTATCDYEADDAGGDATSNTATATLNAIDFTDTEAFSYVTPTTEVKATIYVTDTFNGGAEELLGTVHYSESPKTFPFFTLLSSDLAHNPDVLLVCDANLVVNRADIWTSDDAARVNLGYDIREVPVFVHCADGCTLTQGYWKTHNDSFWGGAPTDATWSELMFYDYINNAGAISGPGDEDSPFFKSGQSFFEVMWTAPKGNVYYNLGRQYIAAQLNFMNDADSSAAQAAFDEATILFKKWSPEDTAKLKGKKGKELRKEFIDLAGVLAKYNEGTIGPGHCDEDLSSDNS